MRKYLLILVALFALMLSACETAPATSDAPADADVTGTEAVTDTAMADGAMMEVNPLEVEGDLVLAGSSTVFPLAEAVMERFEEDGYSGNSTIDSIGSGGGFERFCNGESMISNASRPINDEEVENCAANGIEDIQEFRIGTDGLAVVVNPENDWIDGATIEELSQLFTAERWSDINADWPTETIDRYIPGTDSGTFDFFVEEVFDEDDEPILTAANTQFSEDDNVLVQGVEGDQYGIGFFGYAYYEENQGALKILAIEGVEPNAETVEGDTYPLARPLFMYTTPAIIAENPQVGQFLTYTFNNVNDVINEVGYFPLGEDALNEELGELQAARQ